jgi:LysM repeat protein
VKLSRQGLYNLLIVGISLLMVLGSIIAAIAEGQGSSGSKPTSPAQATDTPTMTIFVSLTPTHSSPTTTTTREHTQTITSSPPSATPAPPTATKTQATTPTECTPPHDWKPYFVQPGNTLKELAQEYGITIGNLKTANCLQTDNLEPGSVIFIPSRTSQSSQNSDPPKEPKPTKTPLPDIPTCGPPSGWVQYTVVAGDNLYRLGIAFGVNVSDLQWANCMGSATTIQAGSNLWVPNRPTNTPDLTDTKTPTKTSTHTPSPTNTSTPTDTATSTPTPTDTSTP